jgi:hypothetical protein
VNERRIVPTGRDVLPISLESSAIIAVGSRSRPALQGPLAELQARPALPCLGSG